jgi:hypothetical protein
LGAFADSLFTLLLGWVRGAVSAIITAFSSGGESGILQFLGNNWIPIVLIIVAVGLVGDWFIWMLRWQPYRVWGTTMRRMARVLRIDHGAQDEREAEARADVPEAEEPAMEQTALYQMSAETGGTDFVPEAENADWLPELTPEEEAAAYEAANRVQDEQLGDYPGMRYDGGVWTHPEETDAAEMTAEQETEQEADFAQREWTEAPEPAPWQAETDAGELEPPEQDVEFSQEFDPLAAYDDPQALRRFMRPEAEPAGPEACADAWDAYPEAEPAEPESDAAASDACLEDGEDTGRRRRRRRAAEALDEAGNPPLRRR